MSVDASLRMTIRQFSTLVLVVAFVTLPLHLAYSFVFRDVIAVSELHPQIEEIGLGRRVRNVGAGTLERSRTAYLIVNAIELAALPLLIRATRRVAEMDDRGEVSGAWRAWRTVLRSSADPPGVASGWTPVVVGVSLAFLVGFVTERTMLLPVQMLPAEVRFVGDALARGMARAVGAPFALVPLALFAPGAKGAEGRTPTL